MWKIEEKKRKKNKDLNPLREKIVSYLSIDDRLDCPF